jgi:hypothetical protein
MKKLNRDLLVVTKKDTINKNELEQTILDLNQLLFHVESFSILCISNEVFDLNKYKIIRNFNQVGYYINSKKQKPFIFISNKN